MNENNQYYLIVLPPNLSHSVINNSKDSFASLYEFASDIQYDVENIEIL